MSERNSSLPWPTGQEEIITSLKPDFHQIAFKHIEVGMFFCSGSNRQGFLCGPCKPGCGISIYTYYGLTCACPCYSYGILLYILLEIGFSTLFFLLMVLLNVSANSSKWITVIVYFEVVAHLIATDPLIYTILAKSWSLDTYCNSVTLWHL